MSAENNNQPDKPIYKCGAFKWLNNDETECVLCSKPGKPKILRTPKYSLVSVMGHLKLHADAQKTYEELVEAPKDKITPYISHGAAGALTPLDRKIVHFLSATHSPFNVVEHRTFKAMLRPTCKCKTFESVKERRHYSDFVLPKMHMYVVARIKSELKELQWLSFTCDAWSGPFASFLGLTAHGITPNWERKRFVLAVREFPGKHTGAAVRALVRDLLTEWGIGDDKVHCILHDQGSDMEAAFANDEIEDMDCAAHKINLICRNGIWPNPKKGEEATPVSTLLTRCRELVGHFRRSHQASALLAEYQELHGLKQKHLIQDVATRWDSTYLMVRRIIEMRQALDTYCINQRRRDLLLSEHDWEVLDELAALLEPFAVFSKMVCSDSAPLGVQVTAYKAFKAELETYTGQHLANEVAKMLSITEDKFGFAVTYKNIAVAHALDPRFKDSLVSGREAVTFRRNVEKWIGEHVDEEPIDIRAVERDLTSSPPPPKRQSLMDKIRAKITNSSPQASASSSQPVTRNDYRVELTKFFAEPTIEWNVKEDPVDPIQWWKHNASRFPLIAPVAKRFLGAPASSAASEQTFSVAKACYDPRRTKLSPQKAEALILLNRNLPLIDYKY